MDLFSYTSINLGLKSLYKLIEVSFSYNERSVLKNINLEIEEGKFYSIVGPNGAGKTTLLYLLSRSLKPQMGQILLNNKSLDSYNRKQLAKQVALVSQEHINFDYTVFDIISMGRYPHKKHFSFSIEDTIKIEQAIELCDLKYLKNKNVLNLSSGEYQRVIIARAIAQETNVLLLDEAFSNLDIKHLVTILYNLISLKKTMISVFHNLALARSADYTIFLKNGSIASIAQKNQRLSSDFLVDFFEIETDKLSKINLNFLKT